MQEPEKPTMKDRLQRGFCHLQIVQDFQSVLSATTGIMFRVEPAPPGSLRVSPAAVLHPFCALMQGDRAGCSFCEQALSEAEQRAESDRAPREIACTAGLREIAVPIFAGTEPIASLLVGPIFVGQFEHCQEKRLTEELRRWNIDGPVREFQKLYRTARVLNADQFAALVRLLGVFAEQLVRIAAQHTCEAGRPEPQSVRLAREFVETRHQDPITMRDAARHVSLSPAHFSKAFRKATGMTFTHYVSSVRIEKAKNLLENGCDRITDAAFAVGFNSIPSFNRVFKRYTGLSPSEFRRTLLGPDTAQKPQTKTRKSSGGTNAV